jgi:hypothetical protein
VPGFWSVKGFRETVRALMMRDVLFEVWIEELQIKRQEMAGPVDDFLSWRGAASPTNAG